MPTAPSMNRSDTLNIQTSFINSRNSFEFSINKSVHQTTSQSAIAAINNPSTDVKAKTLIPSSLAIEKYCKSMNPEIPNSIKIAEMIPISTPITQINFFIQDT